MNTDFLFWASSIAACVSLSGAFLNARKKWYSFVIWACANIFWVIYDFAVGAYFQSALFMAYLSMNLYGLYCWKIKQESGIEAKPEATPQQCSLKDKFTIAKKLKKSGIDSAVIAYAVDLEKDEIDQLVD